VKVLLTPVGSHGDVHPFMALGARMARQGHECTVLTNGAFRDLASRVGLAFVELGTAEEFRRILANPDIWHPWHGPKHFFRYLTETPLRPLFEAIARCHEPGQTLVVGPPTALGARLAQEKLGVPLASVHIAPGGLPSTHRPPVLAGPGMFLPGWAPHWYSRIIYWIGDRWMVDPIMAGPLNAFRAELGLPPVQRVISHWWNSPQLVLGLWPEWFAPPPPDWPPQMRLTGFPLFDESGLEPVSTELEAFLASGEPPIVFTPGSAMLHGRPFFDAAVEACGRLGRRGILLTRFAESLPPGLPPAARHFTYVPLSQVLPRAAAVVHHGGIGTTAQGLAAGIPQLLMPMSYDQPDNAARLARLGVGASLLPRKFTGPRVARKLERLVRPGVQAVCQEIAARFQGQDAVGTACDLIESRFIVSRSEASAKR
jgi:UDP:flavonoid glycosyltransferase YjiC (YdhE family)